MSEEIKEILRFLSRSDWHKEADQLEDYITNLQQKDFESQKEITKLKDKLERQRKEYQDDYKDVRIEIKEKNEQIANLQQENKRLKEQNNDLRKIYRNTYVRLFENGNDELARYFQAQIDDCPTFYVEPIIDYAKEYKIYKSKYEKANKLLKTIYKALPGTYNQLLIEIDNYLQGSDENE